MHIGPTPTHRLREGIARELFDDADGADETNGAAETGDTDEAVRRPHDERARARQRAGDSTQAGNAPTTAADNTTEPGNAPTTAADDTTEPGDAPTTAVDDATEPTSDTTELTNDTTEPTDDRPLAERATDSVFESEPATDVELLDDDRE